MKKKKFEKRKFKILKNSEIAFRGVLSAFKQLGGTKYHFRY